MQCSKLLTICHCLSLRLIARYSGHVRDAFGPAAVELGLEENIFFVVECRDFDAKVSTGERQAAMSYENKADDVQHITVTLSREPQQSPQAEIAC